MKLYLSSYRIVPHFRSGHPKAAAAGRAGKHFAARRVPFRALRDGEVIVWTGPRPFIASDLRRIA